MIHDRLAHVCYACALLLATAAISPSSYGRLWWRGRWWQWQLCALNAPIDWLSVSGTRAREPLPVFVFVPASLLEYSMGRTHQRMYASIHKWLRHIFNGLLISIVATKWRHVFENNKSRRCTVYKLRARTTWCAALCRASLVFYFIFAGFNSLGICCWQTVSAWVSVTATTPIACVFAYNRPPLCLILI